MKLFLDNKTRRRPVSPGWVRRLSGLTLRSVHGTGFEKRSEISVTWIGDREMRGLNRTYRGKDRTTDVLSFPLLEGRRLAAPPQSSLPLGDVVISLAQAERQAKERGVAFRAELALLLVHGILHLLGYDHVTRAQEKRMFGLQDRILGRWKG